MDICLECGIPDLISGRYQWTSGGSIVSKASTHRSVVLDCNQVELVYDLFTFLDGQRAGVVICEAQRKAMGGEVRRTLGNVISRLNLLSLRKKAFGQLRDRATAYGYGDLKVRDYERAGRIVIEVDNPYFTPFIEADLKAIWETLEGTQADLACERRDGHYIYTIESVERREKALFLRKPPREASLTYEGPASGDFEYQRCSSCASPIEASRFSWNIKAGTIYDSMRETYMCISSANTLISAYQDLELHYGPKVGELVMRANKGYTRDLIRGNQILKDLSSEEFMRTLGIRGAAGVVSIQEKPKTVELKIRNPWYVPVVAGEIAGWFEFKYSEDVLVSWVTDEDTTAVKIKRAVPL